MARWLFFIEGSITILVAILSLYILPDFPEGFNTWLTPAEKVLAVQRMVEDVDVNADLHTASGGRFFGFHLAVSDWKVWWLTLIFTTMVTSSSYNYYFPTPVGTLNYEPTINLLLCVPHWLFATGAAILLSR